MSEAVSPIYEANRKEWNERFGRYRSEARMWRIIALLSSAGLVACAGMATWAGTQSHVVPYVVEKNKLGESITVQRLEVSAPFDPIRVKPQLARWVHDMRTVFQDPVAQTGLYTEAYAWVDQNSEAKAALDNWFAAHQPVTRAKAGSVAVTVEDVLPAGGNTWTVDWFEETSAPGSSTIKTFWRADVRIKPYPPQTDEDLISNPGGFYIVSFHMTQRQV